MTPATQTDAWGMPAAAPTPALVADPWSSPVPAATTMAQLVADPWAPAKGNRSLSQKKKKVL